LDNLYEEIGGTMTTATYHPTTGLGQDAWSQSIQAQPGSSPLYGGGIPFGQPYGQQPFGPFGVQQFQPQQFQPQLQQFQPQQSQPQLQQFQPQQFQPQQSQQFASQPWTQAWQQPFGSQTGAQILTVLPALIAQQAQQLYAIAQLCAQQVAASGYQFGPAQQGQRQYQMGY
jgi:hypothetical protein